MDRVKSAIDAHKIAIGHLEEYGIFECSKCSKSYKPSNFIELMKNNPDNKLNNEVDNKISNKIDNEIENKVNNELKDIDDLGEDIITEECSCGSNEFSFQINETGVYRLEIIPYLPLSGNYMVLMSEMTSWGRNPLKSIELIKTRKKGSS